MTPDIGYGQQTYREQGFKRVSASQTSRFLKPMKAMETKFECHELL